MNANDKTLLASLFCAAVAAADPERAILANLPARPKGRTVVVGAGKGAAQLAQAFEKHWDGPLEGTVVTRYGYASPCKRIKIVEAAHPVPDSAGVAASKRLFRALERLTEDDLVVALICGGGSALLPMPLGDLTLDDEAALARTLLTSGAPIGVMNAIRKQFSAIKGGRLAQAARPAKVVSLVVSDVPGDDPAQVASGPTVPDQVTRADAQAMVQTWRIELTARLQAWLDGDEGSAPDPADPVFANNEVRVIGSAKKSLEAAMAKAFELDVPAVILSDRIEGEAREIGKMHAAIAREVALRNRPFAKPVVLLSGGETTVTLRGPGKGGRNTEFALALAIAAEGVPVVALAADTDGIDGSEDNAGAFVCGQSAAQLRALGQSPDAFLANNDSWSAFRLLGDLFVPGPTGTNVNDFRAILIR